MNETNEADLILPVRKKGAAWARGWLEGGTGVLDSARRIVATNDVLSRWLGERPNAWKGKAFDKVLWLRFPEWEPLLRGEWPGSKVFNELQLVTAAAPKRWFALETVRNGDCFFVRVNSVLPPANELAEGGWDECLQSDAARRKMFVRLMHSEGQLDNLVQRWPGVIFSQRADFTFQFASPKIEELTGVPMAEWKQQPQRFWQVVHESDADELKQQFKRAAKAPEGLTTTYRIRHVVTGRVAYILEHRQALVSHSGLVLGYEGVWLDVTRQTIAEKRLSTAAWKETLAALTMGLAHDFSNIMAGIHSLSESFIAQIDAHHPFHEGLMLIKDHSMQASQLVHRIINLHHGKTGEQGYHNLNEVIADLVDLVVKILPRRVKVSTQLTQEALPLYVDVVEFRQVILNMTLNAADAMPDRGTLLFETSLCPQFPAMAHVEGALPGLPAVCLKVQDTGCGIKDRHLASIFDPFFTTKAMNKGSGLGLYNARLFAEKHQGAISVDSVEGEGTMFRIWLPQADFTEGERARMQPSSRRLSLLLLGRAGQVMESTMEFLRVQGYHVVAAHACEKALEAVCSGDYQFVGIYLLAEGAEHDFNPLLNRIRKNKLHLKKILQAVGCNQDELDPRLLQAIDFIVPPDISADEFLKRLSEVLDDPSLKPL